MQVGNKIQFVPVFQQYVPRLAGTWKNSAPIIADGKVLVTAPDADVLQCLNLRDGTLLWKADWTTDDCYVAGVFNGKVLMVGKQVCRAFSIADGKTLGITATPTFVVNGHKLVGRQSYARLKQIIAAEFKGESWERSAPLSVNLSNAPSQGQESAATAKTHAERRPTSERASAVMVVPSVPRCQCITVPAS